MSKKNHRISSLDSEMLACLVNKMASMSNAKFWRVYKDLCLDVTKNRPEYLLRLIKILKEQRPLKNKDNATEFSQKIKKWLSSNDEKWIAICLIGIFVEDLGADVILQNLMFWIRSVLQLINSKSSDAFLDLTLKSIPKLLKISLEFDDLSREISLNTIQPLLNNLLQSTGSKSRCLLNKIAVFSCCIVCYPGPTGRFRTQIENLCLALFSNHEKALRDEACKCMALVPRCGPSGEKATKFAEMWNKQFKMAVDTLNLLFDDLIHIEMDMETRKKKSKTIFKFTQISLAEPEFSTITALRMTSLLSMIKQMLCHKFPHTVQIDVGMFLHLCNRLFSREIDLQDTSIESVCLHAVLPQLWHSMLSLMNVLVAQMGSLVLPFETFIFQIAYQILTTCQKGVDSKSQNASLKIQGYQLLDSWNIIIGPLSSESLKNVVAVLLMDIRPHLQTDRTVETIREGKHKKKKDKTKLQDEIIKDEMARKMTDCTEGSEITYAALTLLTTLISTSGSIMWADLILQIENEVISLCKILMGLSKQADGGFPAPYGNDKCRKKLLQCAFWLTNLYHHQIPTPLSTFISIFQDYVTDPSPIVSKDSSIFLSLMDKIIHPSIPALREYHKDAVIDGTNLQTNANTPLLSTGLFDELHVISHQETTRARNLSNDINQEALLSYTASPSVLFDEVAPPESTSKMVLDNARSEPKQEISNSGGLIQLEKSDQKLVHSKEKPFEIQRTSEKEVQEKNFDFPYEGKATDDTLEEDELVAKRAKFDDILCEGEAKKSLIDTKLLEDSNGAYIQDAKQTDQTEIMEISSDKDSSEIVHKSDDESSIFLKSFVNSFPDSE